MLRAPWVVFVVFLLGSFGHAAPQASEWRSYNGNAAGTRFSPLKQINRANVARLKTAWTYHTGEMALGLAGGKNRPEAFECTPLVVDGVMYMTTPSSRAIALDAETGRELWKYDPQAGTGKRRFMPHRGLAYWEGRSLTAPGKTDRRIVYGTLDGRLIALDARTGHPARGFGHEGAVDLRKGVADAFPDAEYAVTSPPAIYRDLVIVGARLQESPAKGPSGALRAFDVRTGEKVWEFHTIPRPGEPGSESWPRDAWKDRSGANVWAPMSVDNERGVVFAPVGSATYDFYGADRHGSDLYANSVVALDAATGKLLWHFQAVHHDIWDYDVAAAPVLFSVRRGGREAPAIAFVTKMGFVFVLDRTTGKPLFPVEERPVPASEVPGEAASPTQPYPAKIPALARQQPITEADLNTLDPRTAKYCEALFHELKSAPTFTPLGLEQTLLFPGTLGGGNWSGMSFDPASGFLFVNTNNIGTFGALRKQPAGSPHEYARWSKLGPYARFWDENHIPCQRPPWGLLSAVNTNTGDIAWQVPLGIVEPYAARGMRNTGAPSLGGTIATAGGLVFIGGTNDRRFRAFDIATGKVLWETTLEASGHATPVTFQGQRSGKQFVAITAGGGGYFSDLASDAVVAFSLP